MNLIIFQPQDLILGITPFHCNFRIQDITFQSSAYDFWIGTMETIAETGFWRTRSKIPTTRCQHGNNNKPAF